MSQPDGSRDPVEVYAEQVAISAQAVIAAAAADAQQQADAAAWFGVGVPANPTAQTPGPHQRD